MKLIVQNLQAVRDFELLRAVRERRVLLLVAARAAPTAAIHSAVDFVPTAAAEFSRRHPDFRSLFWSPREASTIQAASNRAVDFFTSGAQPWDHNGSQLAEVREQPKV
jgi:hypothetical protein